MRSSTKHVREKAAGQSRMNEEAFRVPDNVLFLDFGAGDMDVSSW